MRAMPRRSIVSVFGTRDFPSAVPRQIEMNVSSLNVQWLMASSWKGRGVKILKVSSMEALISCRRCWGISSRRTRGGGDRSVIGSRVASSDEGNTTGDTFAPLLNISSGVGGDSAMDVRDG